MIALTITPSFSEKDNYTVNAIGRLGEPVRLRRQRGQYDGKIDQKYRKNVNSCTLTPLNNEITWVANGRGSCGSTDSSGTTRWADFTANSAGGGYVIPLVKGNYYTDPIFPIQVFDAWSEVTMNVFIAHSTPVPPATIGNPALSSSSLASVVGPVNEIFKQAGIRFNPVIMPWHSGNGEAYYDIISESQAENALRDCPITSGVRMLFVNSLPHNGWTFLPGSPIQGILCKTNAGTSTRFKYTAAHELGHACGLRDIYDKVTDTAGNTLAEIDPRYKALRGWSLRDWPENGKLNSQPSYYSRFTSGTFITGSLPDSYATRQVNLIPRLLMYGYPAPNGKPDISLGTIHGVKDDNKDGSVLTGLDDMNRFPSQQ